MTAQEILASPSPEEWFRRDRAEGEEDVKALKHYCCRPECRLYAVGVQPGDPAGLCKLYCRLSPFLDAGESVAPDHRQASKRTPVSVRAVLRTPYGVIHIIVLRTTSNTVRFVLRLNCLYVHVVKLREQTGFFAVWSAYGPANRMSTELH